MNCITKQNLRNFKYDRSQSNNIYEICSAKIWKLRRTTLTCMLMTPRLYVLHQTNTALQNDLNIISTCASDRLPNFNTEKCCVLHISKHNAHKSYNLPNRTNNTIHTLMETSAERYEKIKYISVYIYVSQIMLRHISCNYHITTENTSCIDQMSTY